MEWFQKGCQLSLIVFTKKSRKLLPELWCIASKDKPSEKKKKKKKERKKEKKKREAPYFKLGPIEWFQKGC